MELDGKKQWKCENGHVLGVVQREKVSQGERRVWITRLLLFRHAIDLQSGQMAEGDVAARVEGTVFDVRCDVAGCGAVRSWYIGEEMMEMLVEKMMARKQDE
jgi:hypothetical protein